jgi:hypothetical protein
MARTTTGLVIVLVTVLAVTSCSASIPYAAAPHYHFPSNGDHEGVGG